MGILSALFSHFLECVFPSLSCPIPRYTPLPKQNSLGWMDTHQPRMLERALPNLVTRHERSLTTRNSLQSSVTQLHHLLHHLLLNVELYPNRQPPLSSLLHQGNETSRLNSSKTRLPPPAPDPRNKSNRAPHRLSHLLLLNRRLLLLQRRSVLLGRTSRLRS